MASPGGQPWSLISSSIRNHNHQNFKHHQSPVPLLSPCYDMVAIMTTTMISTMLWQGGSTTSTINHTNTTIVTAILIIEQKTFHRIGGAIPSPYIALYLPSVTIASMPFFVMGTMAGRHLSFLTATLHWIPDNKLIWLSNVTLYTSNRLISNLSHKE